jgi:excisionase family DNA binding protein
MEDHRMSTIQQQGADFKITVERVDRSIPDPDEEPTIPVKRYAQIMGVSLRTAYMAIAAGEVPYIQVGGRKVIPTRQALAALLEGQKTSSAV